MKTFRVYAKSITYCYVDVEAENEYEALDMAEDIDGGEFSTEIDGDWETYAVIEMDSHGNAVDEVWHK